METQLLPGYGDQGLGQDPMAGGDPSLAGGGQQMEAPGPMDEIQPMVEGYLSNPDPALAEEIIMTLANLLGVAPPVAPQAPAQMGPGAGADPMAGMGAPAPQGPPAPGFKNGGKVGSYLKTLKLK